MKEQKFQIFTVGHSNQTMDSFLNEIKSFGINAIVDVRSVPMSWYCPQFNASTLSEILDDNGILYVPLGKEFGARRDDSIGDNNQVDFELAIETAAFREGVRSLEYGINQGYKIALMCVEANPLKCHRFALLGRYFYRDGYDVQHILKANLAKSHKELQDQMVSDYIMKKKIQIVIPQISSYSEDDQIRDAYRLKNFEIGYKFKS